jgi:hypothetical protein
VNILLIPSRIHFDQAKVETTGKQKEERSKRAIPGETRKVAALRHGQGAFLIPR